MPNIEEKTNIGPNAVRNKMRDRIWLAAETSAGEYAWSVAFSRNFPQLASTSKDCTVKMWDVSSGECLETFEGHSDSVQPISFS